MVPLEGHKTETPGRQAPPVLTPHIRTHTPGFLGKYDMETSCAALFEFCQVSWVVYQPWNSVETSKTGSNNIDKDLIWK